jgi:hypothetical protein
MRCLDMIIFLESMNRFFFLPMHHQRAICMLAKNQGLAKTNGNIA